MDFSSWASRVAEGVVFAGWHHGAVHPNWFIGLPVPAEPWFSGLVTPRDLRRFAPADLHLTVAFLGGCTPQQAHAAWACPTPGGPFTVQLAGIAPMGNPRRPSALAVLLDDPAEVAGHIGRWRQPMWRAAGARPDTRPPKPHCTVARPRRKATDAERAAAVRWARSVPPLGTRLHLDRIALYTWSDDRRASLFRIVDERVLSSDPASGCPA